MCSESFSFPWSYGISILSVLSFLKAPINSNDPTTSEVVKDAMATLLEASVPYCNQRAIVQAKNLVDKKITNLTHIKGTHSADQPHSTLGAEDQPRQLFTSNGVK